MAPIDKEGSRIWRRKIRDILNRDWDPIGDCPEDEYESYVGDIAAMLRDNVSDEKLMQYLRWAEAEHMGFGIFDAVRAEKVIALVRALPIP